ncbi:MULTISPECIES: YnbE family lipoprotein [Glaesserella]|uniref:YnbE family lipoprotein n=1 Tax=Glaesserella australis TaxID=2094024 RepID=A0A328BY50_9PAST|nr:MULTISPECIES: YnbE family lipoprotein [Glaesserella]AUI65313.1 YnbE family lipoprotein [Glaesserella sp. 15-184]RAL18585.1 YnbE family lipoprotein [Glaesserella australis]
MKTPLFFAIFCLNLTACTPKVQLETPPEGITINMNVVVDHKIEVTMDKQSRAVIKTVDNAETQK